MGAEGKKMRGGQVGRRGVFWVYSRFESPRGNSRNAALLIITGSQLAYRRSQQDPDLATPARNLAIGMYSATVYDLGSTYKVTNNIFTLLPTLFASISTTNRNATTPGVAGATLSGAVAFANDPSLPLPATGQVVIRASYLCRVKQLKNAAGFIFAVTGVAMSLFVSVSPYRSM